MKHFMERWISGSTCSILAAAVILMSVQIFLRFVFNSPLTWTEEVDRYLFVWSVYLGSAVALAKGSHIRVTFLIDLGGPALEKISKAFNKVCSGFSFAIIMYYGYKLAYANIYSRFYTVEFMPLVLFYLAVPVGMTLMLIYLIGTARTTT
jgi:TRAP-type C4-dicarboxylate transport system permease small subunit